MYIAKNLRKSEELGYFHFWGYQVFSPSIQHEKRRDYIKQTACVIDQPLDRPWMVVSEHEGSSDCSRQTAYVMDQPPAIALGSCLSINSGLDKRR